MFIHLRVHSAYSLLEGALHLKRIVALAAEDSQPAVAVTDSASLFGALEFSEYAFGAGVQPIVGCTMPLALAERIQGGRTIAPIARLPLIAANPTGFDNLQKLISKAYLASAGLSPCISLEDLTGLQEGIIALTGWHDGPLGLPLGDGHDDEAAEILATLTDAFGDRLYMELQRHGTAADGQLEAHIVDLAYDRGLPLVATNEAYFAARDD